MLPMPRRIMLKRVVLSPQDLEEMNPNIVNGESGGRKSNAGSIARPKALSKMVGVPERRSRGSTCAVPQPIQVEEFLDFPVTMQL